MKIIKRAVASIFVLVICLFSTLITPAQNTTPSPAIQGNLNQIKDKRRIFVDIENKNTKQDVEKFFRKTGAFEVIQNSKDAEIVYSAVTMTDSRPSFGTVENRSQLPTPAASRDLTGIELRNLQQISKTEIEYLRKTSALVYFNSPSGDRITVWAEQAERFSNQTENGAYLERFLKAGEELPLAKEFVKDLKEVK